MKKSVGLTILFWVETIVSARVLLFTFPVLINKYLMKTFSAAAVEDWFILVVTLVAVAYFIVGVASIAGSKISTVLHYIAVVLTGFLTFNLLPKLSAAQIPVTKIHLAPAIFAVAVTLLAVFAGRKETA